MGIDKSAVTVLVASSNIDAHSVVHDLNMTPGLVHRFLIACLVPRSASARPRLARRPRMPIEILHPLRAVLPCPEIAFELRPRRVAA